MTSLAHPVDIAIFAAFLGINLAVGLFYGKKVKSFEDYAIGNKNFSTATLTATVVMSWIGGRAVFYMLENTYTDGLYFVMVILGGALCLFLVAQLATRMGPFMSNLSMAEAMGKVYGQPIQIISAISGILSVIGVVAIEFQVIATIISLIFNIESSWVTVLAASIVVLYSISGGVRAVTFTDVFQFLTFGTFIPILTLIIAEHLKGSEQVIEVFRTDPNFILSEVIGWHPKFLTFFVMFLWFAVPGMDPVVFQRISMARDVQQAKASFIRASGISALAVMGIAWMAVLLLATDRTLEPDKLVSYIIQNYAHAGLRGFIGIGIMALAMSTADSYLNASAVLLTNDIVKPLKVKLKHKVLTARLFCCLSGIVALLLALYSPGMLELLMVSSSLYMPVVTVPLLMSIVGFRTTTRAALIGMAAGLLTVVVWSIFGKNSDSIVPGMLANLIGLVGTHYLLGEKGGWVKKVTPAQSK